MQIPALIPTKHSRPECAVANNLQLHTTSDRLSNTICAAETLHLQCILGLTPRKETGF